MIFKIFFKLAKSVGTLEYLFPDIKAILIYGECANVTEPY